MSLGSSEELHDLVHGQRGDVGQRLHHRGDLRSQHQTWHQGQAVVWLTVTLHHYHSSIMHDIHELI